jgi:hypothetical protein
MVPRTANIRPASGQMPARREIDSQRLRCSSACPSIDGVFHVLNATKPMKARAYIWPGRMPARKSLPIETSSIAP